MPWEKLHVLHSSCRHFSTWWFLRGAKHALELVIHLYYSIKFFPLSSDAAFLQISAPQRAKDRLSQSDRSDLANLVEPALLNLQFMTVFLTYPYNISQRETETETILTKHRSYCIPSATGLFGSLSNAQGDITWHCFWRGHAGTFLCPSQEESSTVVSSFCAPLSAQRTYFKINRRKMVFLIRMNLWSSV